MTIINDVDWDHPKEHGYLLTVGHRWVSMAEPDPATINLTDIAHALSNVCRFGGHLPTFYSVAEHSLNVSAQLYRQYGVYQLAMAGLLHDASEAYLGDVIRPLKNLLGDAYRDIERRMEKVIAEAFKVEWNWFEDNRVKHVDQEILAWEMAMVRDCYFRTPSEPSVVRQAFVDRFYELQGD